MVTIKFSVNYFFVLNLEKHSAYKANWLMRTLKRMSPGAILCLEAVKLCVPV
jgi:hypothetical protein